MLVSNFQTNGAAGANSLPVDQIALNFAAIEIEYKPQNADGSLGSKQVVKYDLKQMTGK